MSRLVTALSLCLALALPGVAPAQEADAGPADIITRQFDAFRADALDEAFSFASPMIRFQFQTPDNFGMMVQQGYPMVRDPGQVRMLDLREEDGQTIQRVEVIDGKGNVTLLDYRMIRTEDGWKINGVSFVKDPPLAA